ncbi:pentapeptide repeat-containing protein [Amycolatopsis sp. NPDC051758]|uniref:pentapeptide repeat-containing protein n=1 Tax=Amycolatopsis sp. NPDC051758 TaxID=3363935 RepID=UPI0037A0ECA8
MKVPQVGSRVRPDPVTARRVAADRRLAAVGRTALATTALVIAAVGFVLLLLGPLSWWLATDNVRNLRGKEQADALNAVRQTVLLALAGGATLSGAAFTARSFVLARRGQVTERFHKATAQLGAATPEERLGGIYALEQIWRESTREHAAILELLCSYVRTRSTVPLLPDDSEDLIPPWLDPAQPVYPPELVRLAIDVQAVMTVIARRPARPEPHRPMLIGASLPRVAVRVLEFDHPPRLSSIFFTGADLRMADLRGADLTKTIMNYADMRGAALEGACLHGARLYRADLRRVSWAGASLTGADLSGANLSDSDIVDASQLADVVIDSTTILPQILREDPWVAARIEDCESVSAAGGRRCPPRTPEPLSG